MCSALEGRGLAEIWQAVKEYKAHLDKTGEFSKKRARQNLNWMKAVIEEELLSGFYRNPGVKASLGDVQNKVKAGDYSAREGAEILLKAYFGEVKPNKSE